MQRTRTRTRGTAMVALATALLWTACSGADQADTDDQVVTDEQARVEADAAAPGGAGDDGGEAAQEPGSTEQPADDVDAAAGRMIIRRAGITLSSDDPDATAADVRARAREAGGFVSGTELYRQDGLLRGTITIRIPAEALDPFLEAVADTAAEVTAQTVSSEDVTTQVADIEARLRNLRAVEEELLALLGDARESGDTEQVLQVYDRVSEIRTEIETLEGRREAVAEQVALSTVTVTIEPSPALVQSTIEQPDDGPLPWSPGNRAESAWNAAVAGMRGFVDAAIGLVVYVIPVALVWTSPFLLLALAWWWWRRRGGRAGGSQAPAHAVPPAGPAPSRDPGDRGPAGERDDDVAVGSGSGSGRPAP